MFPEQNQPIDLKNDLVDLATYRTCEALTIRPIYTQENEVYQDGKIIAVDEKTYEQYIQMQPNDLVNKFGAVYAKDTPMLLHKRLADVIIDAAIDLHKQYKYVTVVMDALRTYDSGRIMGKNRPDLVESGLLARAGNSAHNRALAVDSKLFEKKGKELVEADEHGHLDDLNMETNSRFYAGKMSDAARKNRLARLQAWQRASVKNKLPIANLLSEFWDDRVPGSPADMWRVLACRALCLGISAHPKTHPGMAELKKRLEALTEQQQQNALITRRQCAERAYAMLLTAWNELFTPAQKKELETLLGKDGSEPPALQDFLFHEWLETINDTALEKARGFRQAAYRELQMAAAHVLPTLKPVQI